jgi:TolA-binding protein
MNEPTKYTAYVVPSLSHARIDTQWDRIAERLPAGAGFGSGARGLAATRRSMSALLLGLAAVSVAAVVWWQFPPRTADSVWEGSVVTSDDAPVNMTLAEGTLIELEPRSEVSLMHSSARAVQVSLTDGSARFEVAKRRSRRFSVQLGAVEVLVTGTQFRVARTAVSGGDRVRVDVEEGSVEVHRKGAGVVLLEAGDHWSAFVSQQDVEESEGELGDDEPAVDSSASSAADEEGEDSPDEAREDHHGRRSSRRARARAQVRAAEELFGQANVARRSGRVDEAAKLYGDLVNRHARDRRAALAAFELGRLRMDSLGDVRGAVEALDRALKLDARRAFAEDALARLVLAQEALGDRPACMRARERYLARYPEGVHAQHVALRCGGGI